MVILGINGGIRMGYQDISAALVVDGKVVAAIEEERLNRIKHSAGQIPYLAITEVLKIANLTINDVDYVASHGSTWGDAYVNVLKEYFNRCFGFCPKIERVHHHVAHAASTYYASGFDEAMVLTMDASGDGIALQKAIGKGQELKVVEQVSRTNSLGIFYAMMTQFCGFVRDTDEYKLMGLAPYGDPSKVDLSEVFKVNTNGYLFDTKFIKELVPGQPQPTKHQAIFNEKLTNLLGKSRIPNQPITQHYKNIAAATQLNLKNALVALVTDFHHQTGIRKLCLAGGVALNCAANQFLMELDFIDEIYIQPAAGDNGISLGAAYVVAKELGDTIQPMEHAYLGNQFSNDDVKSILNLTGVRFTHCENPAQVAAKLVAENKVIGWFQGRMEYGPRALGNRSILANPIADNMKSIINAKIKFRESFRPFCPSVLEEDVVEHFTGKQNKSPYMTINYKVKDPSKLVSVSHVDDTARIQTVNNTNNLLYYNYLTELKKEIGVGVSINTSFNRNKEPIVNTPIQAISAFYGSGMDALMIGNYLLKK